MIEKQGARVHVYTTHLDYRADPSVRQTQVEETLDILADDEGESRVLVGDFNADAGGPGARTAVAGAHRLRGPPHLVPGPG